MVRGAGGGECVPDVPEVGKEAVCVVLDAAMIATDGQARDRRRVASGRDCKRRGRCDLSGRYMIRVLKR
jgi:hypothetical protein